MAAALLIAGGVVFANRGCLNQKAPDERLAGHFDALCDIARANVDSPQPGVRQLGRYLGAHGGDMLGDFGDTLGTIERISDDHDHDARAELARDRIRTPVLACAHDWNDFADAIAADPDASAALETGAARLSRTLSIIFEDATPGTLDLHRLPARLSHIFDTSRR